MSQLNTIFCSGKFLPIIMLLTIGIVSQAQPPVSHNNLDVNNVNAMFTANGNNFWGLHSMQGTFTNMDTIPKYHYPANSEKSTIKNASIWIGGLKQDSIHTAMCLLGKHTHLSDRKEGREFWPGPIPQNSQPTSSQSSKWNTIWQVEKADVQAHITDYQADGQINGPIPNSIRHWPAKGNPQAKGNNGVSLTINQKAAPFVDVDSNGIYEPSKGDYPAMKGDQMLWWVYNDLYGQQSATGAAQMGVEIRASAYACQSNTDSLLNRTTFVHYEVENKSSTSYQDVYLGSWTDFAVGCAYKDYVGSHPATDSYYGYSAHPDTCQGGKEYGYGKHPLLQAVTILKSPIANNGMASFKKQTNDFSIPTNPPTPDYLRFYQHLKGEWKDSTSFTYGGNGYGGNQPADYMFQDDACDTSSNAWSEISNNYTPGDRQGLAGIGPVQQFAPGQTLEVAWAYITTYHDTSQCHYGFPEQDVKHIRQFYKNDINVVGLQDSPQNDRQAITIHPNPADEHLMIQTASFEEDKTLSLIDVTGRVHLKKELNGTNARIAISELESGIYFVHIQQDDRLYTKKVVVK